MGPTLIVMSAVLAVGSGYAACSKYGSKTASSTAAKIPSDDILSRAPVTATAEVKHVLVGWSDLAPAYRGQMDPRAAGRSKSDADKLALELLQRVRRGDAIEALMSEYSEDPGSASSGNSYTATPDAPLVEPFKALSLRLNVGEAGAVETQFGWHIIKRVQ